MVVEKFTDDNKIVDEDTGYLESSLNRFAVLKSPKLAENYDYVGVCYKGKEHKVEFLFFSIFPDEAPFSCCNTYKSGVYCNEMGPSSFIKLPKVVRDLPRRSSS